MAPPLFWIFSAIMLFFGLMVIVNRKPGHQRAQLGRLLPRAGGTLRFTRRFLHRSDSDPGLCRRGDGAFFVHHHAVGSQGGARRRLNLLALFGGAVVVIALFVKILFDVSYGFQDGTASFPPIQRMPQGDVWQIGLTLFQHYNLPLQIIGALVVVASIGVVVSEQTGTEIANGHA